MGWGEEQHTESSYYRGNMKNASNGNCAVEGWQADTVQALPSLRKVLAESGRIELLRARHPYHGFQDRLPSIQRHSPHVKELVAPKRFELLRRDVTGF
jgi:hypothetical protein